MVEIWSTSFFESFWSRPCPRKFSRPNLLQEIHFIQENFSKPLSPGSSQIARKNSSNWGFLKWWIPKSPWLFQYYCKSWSNDLDDLGVPPWLRKSPIGVFRKWLKNKKWWITSPKHHPTFLASAMSTQSDTNQPSRWSLNVSGMFDLYFMPTVTVGGHCMLSMKKDNRLDSSVDSCNLTHVKSFVDLTAPFTLVESGWESQLMVHVDRITSLKPAWLSWRFEPSFNNLHPNWNNFGIMFTVVLLSGKKAFPSLCLFFSRPFP